MKDIKISNKWDGIEEHGDYMELIQEDISETFKDNYFRILKKYLSFENIKHGEINILMIPSFEPELLLKVSKENLYLEKVTSNVFQNYYQDKLKEVKLEKEELKINNKLVNSFVWEVEERFEEGIIYPSGAIVLDGVMYYFITNNHGIERIGFKHSPQESTKMGKLVIKLEEILQLFK